MKNKIYRKQCWFRSCFWCCRSLFSRRCRRLQCCCSCLHRHQCVSLPLVRGTDRGAVLIVSLVARPLCVLLLYSRSLARRSLCSEKFVSGGTRVSSQSLLLVVSINAHYGRVFGEDVSECSFIDTLGRTRIRAQKRTPHEDGD